MKTLLPPLRRAWSRMHAATPQYLMDIALGAAVVLVTVVVVALSLVLVCVAIPIHVLQLTGKAARTAR